MEDPPPPKPSPPSPWVRAPKVDRLKLDRHLLSRVRLLTELEIMRRPLLDVIRYFHVFLLKIHGPRGGQGELGQVQWHMGPLICPGGPRVLAMHFRKELVEI